MKQYCLAAVCIVATGCYTLQPVAATGPLFGSNIALDINDAGRVALNPSMGAEIAQVEGRLVRRDSSEYVLAVSVIRKMRDDVEQKWTGETVTVKSAYVTGVHQRKLARGRSVLLGAAVVAAVASIVTRVIIGAGQPDTPPVPVDTARTSRRGWP